MTAIGKFLLFFSSWFPAYAMMGFLTFESSPKIGWAYFAFSLLSVLIYFAMERLIFGRAERSLKVASIERRDENVLMYIIAYLPPFFALDLSKEGQMAATALFYLIFAITYVKLDLYYLNPMFVFRSFKTFTIKSVDEEEYVALIKGDRRPSVGETINYRGRDHILLIDNN